MSTRKWSDDTMMRFVRLYEAEPVLWDSTHKEYKNKNARTSALSRIVKGINLNDFGIVECKLKIKNLRTHYWQEIGKMRSSIVPGSTIYTPTVVWFKAVDKFLRRLVTQNIDNELVLKEVASNVKEITLDADKVEIKVEPDSSEEDSVPVLVDAVLDIISDDESDTIREPVSKRPRSSRSSKRTASTIREEIDEIRCTLPFYTHQALEEIQKFLPNVCNKRFVPEKNAEDSPRQKLGNTSRNKFGEPSTREEPSTSKTIVSSASPQEQPFDIFGKSVSAQLKMLPKRQAIETQLKIQSLLTEQLLANEDAYTDV